jgi:hypothetical protein
MQYTGIVCMKIPALPILASLIAMTSLAQPGLSSQSEINFGVKQSNSCNASLTDLRRRIRADGRNIDIEFEVREISQPWSFNSPSGRPYELRVLLGNPRRRQPAALDVMESDQMLNSIAANVIRGCSDVAVVSYGLSQSDYIKSFGLVNSRVQPFQCLPSRSRGTPPPRWGWQYC